MKKTITTLSSGEFSAAITRAKKAARKGPVLITHRGRPSHVLLSFESYQDLTGESMTLADALACPGSEDIEFDPPRLGGPLAKPVDFS